MLIKKKNIHYEITIRVIKKKTHKKKKHEKDQQFCVIAVDCFNTPSWAANCSTHDEARTHTHPDK